MARTASRVGLCIWLVFGGHLPARAAPFAEQITFTQPDGATITLWGEGDEFHAVFETLDGFTVVFDPALRAYCYAELSADGRALLSTGTPVHLAAAASLGLSPHLRLPAEVVRRRAAERRARWEAGMEVRPRWESLKAARRAAEAAGPDYAPPSSPTVGTKVGLCLLIDFEDDPATIPQADIVAFCNADGYRGHGNNGSVKEYFRDVSNGRLTYSNVVTVYVRIPNSVHPKSYYNDTTKDAGEQANLLIKDALDLLKAMPNYETEILPSFDALTVNAQNRVVACNVFYAGGNGGVWSMGLWPHSWSLVEVGAQELSPGGKKVYRYQITNLGSSLKLGTFCHENGHLLCGFPDIYDYDYDSKGGAGVFCLMNSGASGGNPVQVCAYLKNAAGWATLTDLTSTSALLGSLSAIAGPDFNHFYRYKKPGSSTEYFLLECRYKTNRDSSLPASGVAIWHIDELGDRDDQRLAPNTLHHNYECTLVQADNRWDFQKNVNSGDDFDLYHSGNTAAAYNNTFSDASSPNAHWWDGSASGLNLHHFSARAPTMTFAVGNVQLAPVITSPPADLLVVEGSNATFTVEAAGAPPLAYVWRKDGVVVPDAITDTLSLTNVRLSDAGGYSVTVANAYGSAASSNAWLTVLPRISLAEALEATNLVWSAEPAMTWLPEVTVTRDQEDAVMTAALGHGQECRLRAVAPGPGRLTFWWKVSSEAGADFLWFAIEGAEQKAVSGEADWTLETFDIPPGYQTLEWVYTKNNAASAGQDKAWLDTVQFVAIPMPPVILAAPQSLGVLRGQAVSLSVLAEGSPPLAYQWELRGTNIPGATASALVFAAFQEGDAGPYSVSVSNAHGVARSAPAMLNVTTVTVSGDNTFGQCSPAAGATELVAVAAGGWHTLGLRADGRVVAWGNNWDGQCTVPGALPRALAIAAGGYHSLALLENGTVAAWGANYYNQARPPAGLSNVLAIAAGAWHSLALTEEGRVAAWGDNSAGQASVPEGLQDMVGIAAGGRHSLAVRRDGTVVAWGDNTDAQGGWAGQSVPPPGLSSVVAVAAGEYHSLALRSDGTVVGWGDNTEGQAQAPAGLADVVAVSAGAVHSLALRRDGTVVAWGSNWRGQAALPPAVRLATVAAGGYHTAFLLDDGLPQPRLWRVGPRPTGFGMLLHTQPRSQYALESAENLTDAVWIELSRVSGNGALRLFVDSAPAPERRFYRIRQF